MSYTKVNTILVRGDNLAHVRHVHRRYVEEKKCGLRYWICWYA